jgi:hypothetical protein
LTCTVTGLTNGTSYTFTVTATNGAGTSTPSNASWALIPTQPTTTRYYANNGSYVLIDASSSSTECGTQSSALYANGKTVKNPTTDALTTTAYTWTIESHAYVPSKSDCYAVLYVDTPPVTAALQWAFRIVG